MTLVFSYPGNESMAAKVREGLAAEEGRLVIRHFPDGESYVQVISDVAGKQVIVVATLHRPDDKFLPLVFLLQLLKESRARKITLVSPYLAYMRQDKKFKAGEAVTSSYFAALLSGVIDELITIDPHLHRRSSMTEIYSVPCLVEHAAPLVSEWIKNSVIAPVLIGPDSESEQWVSSVAKDANAPYLVLDKQRLGDREVRVSIPNLTQFKHYTPVLIDDIISTARTMIAGLQHFKKTEMQKPVCIGVHGVFSGNAFEELLEAGASRVVTSNSIPHVSNQIDLSSLVIKALRRND
jgi:ribose-phosphate pyrophosphokinase